MTLRLQAIIYTYAYDRTSSEWANSILMAMYVYVSLDEELLTQKLYGVTVSTYTVDYIRAFFFFSLLARE